MIFLFFINILLIIGLYNTNSIVSKEHILNNATEFSAKEYQDFFITDQLFHGYKYPKSDRIESDGKLIADIISNENLLNPINLICQFNVPGYLLIKKIIAQKKMKEFNRYKITCLLLKGEKSYLDEERATEIIKYGSNSKLDQRLYDKLQNLNNEIQTSFLPYSKERKQAIVNYISSTLENNSLEKINILNTPLHFKFLSEILFWSMQILFIFLWILSLMSVFIRKIKIPILGKMYQKLLFFV